MTRFADAAWDVIAGHGKPIAQIQLWVETADGDWHRLSDLAPLDGKFDVPAEVPDGVLVYSDPYWLWFYDEDGVALYGDRLRYVVPGSSQVTARLPRDARGDDQEQP